MTSIRMAQEAQWAELAEKGVRYCFVITHVIDFDVDDEDGVLRFIAGTVYGPRDASEIAITMARMDGQAWRVLDADGNVCAIGLMWASDSPADWSNSDAAFAPLHDYGVGAHGATELQYQRDGEWRTL